MLTVEQIRLLLELLQREFGMGYSDVPGVGALQASLSIQLEAAARMNRHSEPITIPDRAAIGEEKHG